MRHLGCVWDAGSMRAAPVGCREDAGKHARTQLHLMRWRSIHSRGDSMTLASWHGWQQLGQQQCHGWQRLDCVGCCAVRAGATRMGGRLIMWLWFDAAFIFVWWVARHEWL
jgi:hypothetical protein